MMLTKPYSDMIKRNGHAVNRAQLDGEVQDMNEVMHYQKKTRCSSSKGKTPFKNQGRNFKKMLSFIVNPRCKPVKKQRGFRRRTGRPLSSTVDGHGDCKRVSMAKSLSRRKKKRKNKCNVMAQAASQQPSVPSKNAGLAPRYPPVF